MGLPPAAYPCATCGSAQSDGACLELAAWLTRVVTSPTFCCPTCETVAEFPPRDPKYPTNAAHAVRRIAVGREVRELCEEVARAIAGGTVDALLEAATTEKQRLLLRAPPVVAAIRPAFANGARLAEPACVVEFNGMVTLCERASRISAEGVHDPPRIRSRTLPAGQALSPTRDPEPRLFQPSRTAVLLDVAGQPGVHAVPADLLRPV